MIRLDLSCEFEADLIITHPFAMKNCNIGEASSLSYPHTVLWITSVRRRSLKSKKFRTSKGAFAMIKPANTLVFENRDISEWLNSKEAAQLLSISENALRIMAHRHQIPVFKFGMRLPPKFRPFVT